ncbi:MAG: lipid-binding SYLF domain-containing protein [Gallionellaceae bacterium]|nr:lipid-binding SYLF domain-containing protein [Gallionellaceae bacterium]
MKTLIRYLIGLAALFAVGAAPAATNDPIDRIEAATDILSKTIALPEQEIPPALLKNAQGIAVIPGVIKAGFVIGGSYGKGVLTVRSSDGRWSQPIFIKLAAGSLGWQIGAQSTDVVLVFKTRRSVEGLIDGTFTLGADAAVAAGPVGRRGEAATDLDLKAEILSYSRSRGLFAGVSLEGAKLDVDKTANTEFYGRAVRPREIMDGQVAAHSSAGPFMQAVYKVTGN